MRRLGILILLFAGAFAVLASPPGQASLFELFLLQARNDLELVADEVYGEGSRPDSWTFNFDLTSESFVGDLWYDHETAAERIFGDGLRPEGWFGATTFTPRLLARNVRHDLEISADRVYGGATARPDGWNGAEPIFRCSLTTQNLIRYLDEIYNRRSTTVTGVADYCQSVRFELESDLLPVAFDRIDAFTADRLTQRVLAIRGDLERTANEVFGVNNRPGAWIGNVDESSPTLAADISTDIESLATSVFGGPSRPEGWARFIAGSPAVNALNLRFNLETLTDVVLENGARPNGWQGIDPLGRCDPQVQALAYILGDLLNFVADRDIEGLTTAQYCANARANVNFFADNPPARDFDELVDDPGDRVFTAEAENAWAFLDVAALQYMGAIPPGTRFRAWYRNFQESTMMYVTGVDQEFGVFIDLRWTSLDPDVFARLPTLENVRPLTYCNATWCNGPGPTPTPRGGSAVERLVLGAGTAVPDTQTVEEVRDTTGKRQVSWNHVRVTYLLDRPDANAVQVALEICFETAQINCEPVTSVLDQGLGVQRPVVDVFNGLNVFELPYGYSTNVIIEGASLVSPDVWISDPTLR